MSAGDEDAGRSTMTAARLRRLAPAAVAEIEQEARAQERERIRAIEEVARPGAEDLIETAKYRRPETTADEVARALVRRDQRIRRAASMERDRE